MLSILPFNPLNYHIVLPDEKTISSFCAVRSPMYDITSKEIKN